MGIRPGSSERPDWPLAIVIGAGGMGMAIARRLGQRHRLLLVDVDGAHGEAQAAGLRADGYDAVAHGCDITDVRNVAAMAARVSDMGGFRTMAHVAGLSPGVAPADAIVRVNLVGVALVEEALAEIATQGSSAVLISSLAAHLGTLPDAVLAEADRPLEPDLLQRLESAADRTLTPHDAYRITKQAMLRRCRQRAHAWGRRGARIVSLSPGLIATPMGAREFEKNPQKYAMLERSPLQREGTMLEIADAVEFLASDRASFINGTDLLADGGMAAAMAFPPEEHSEHA